MKKKNYLIIALGVYIIFIAIKGIYQSLLYDYPHFLKAINCPLMLAYLGVGVFLMKLKNWARITAIICAFLYFGLFLSALFVLNQKQSLHDIAYIQRTFVSELLVHFIINIFTIYYLTRPRVKEQFK